MGLPVVQDGYIKVDGNKAVYSSDGPGHRAKLYIGEPDTKTDGPYIVITDGPNTGKVAKPYIRVPVEFGPDPVRLELVIRGHKPTIITSWAIPRWSAIDVKATEPFNRLQDSVSELLGELARGKVKMEYIKVDGTSRRAVGTTSQKLIPRHQQYKHGKFEEKGRLLFYYDLQKKDWRCLRIDSLESFSR